MAIQQHLDDIVRVDSMGWKQLLTFST